MTTRGIEGVSTRMIGRDTELAALQAAFARLVEPNTALQRVSIVSEAGVGKSRLLHEFESWVETRPERCLLFRARATPQTRAQPYCLVRDLFAGHAQILDDDGLDIARRKLEDALLPLFTGEPETDSRTETHGDAEAQVHLLGHLIGFRYDDSPHIRGIRDDPQQIHDRAFRAAAQALRRLAGRNGQPILVLVDDLHWADDGSLDFIDHVAQADGDTPLLIVSLARPTLFERRAGAAGADGGLLAHRIELQPLGVTESRRLASELLQRLPEIPPELQDMLTSRGVGNPFYMEELVKMLIDQGAIVTTGVSWSLDVHRLRAVQVPTTLTGVLQARLDGLPASERRALQLASVIGVTFWDAALEHVDAEAPAQLPALRARALVEPRNGLQAVVHEIREHSFTHQILHQVTYDTVLRRVKQNAHARVADWVARHAGILGTRLLAVAAEHYERAGDSANAAEHYARAAAYMVEIYAHEAAIESSTRGLGLVDEGDSELRWRLLSLREQGLQMLGRRDVQRADIDALAAIADAMPPGAPGDRRRAEVARLRSDFAHRIGDWPAQEREARRCQALAAAAGDEALSLRAIRRLAEALAFQGDAAAGRALAEPALTRAKELGLPRLESGLLVGLTVCTDALGDRVAGLQQSLQDLALNRRSENRVNEAVALSNVGMSYLTFGAFAEARRYLEDALRMHRMLGNREIEGNTHSVLSELAWREGSPDVAQEHAQAASDIAAETGTRLYQADALWSLGNARLALGNFAGADEAFGCSYALAREIGSGFQQLNALDGRTRVAFARRDLGEAGRFIEDLLRLADDVGPTASTTAAPDSAIGSSVSASPNRLAGAYEHLIRLTIFRVWSTAGDGRAGPLLAEAYDRLMAEADRVRDSDLRERFLACVAEHREIRACAEHAACGGAPARTRGAVDPGSALIG